MECIFTFPTTNAISCFRGVLHHFPLVKHNFPIFLTTMHVNQCSFQMTYGVVRESLNKFPDVILTGTFIDSIHMKFKSPWKKSPLVAMHLLYRSDNFWMAPWKASCVNLSMTLVTVSFISTIVS